MLSLNGLTDNNASLRPTEQKPRGRLAVEPGAQGDFQSYLAAAIQQPRPEPVPEPASTRIEAQRTESTIQETRAPEAQRESAQTTTGQKAGNEAAQTEQTEKPAKDSEKYAGETAQPKSKAVTVTRSDRELLEALGLINRKSTLPEKAHQPGMLRAAMEAAVHQAKQKPVVLKGESPARTLTLLEKSPDMILMSSDGLKKLGEKLGLSLLGKVQDKLAEKHKPAVNHSTATVSAARSSTETTTVTHAQGQKAGAGDQHAFSESQHSKQARTPAHRHGTKEPVTADATNALKANQGENIATQPSVQMDNTTARSHASLQHPADLRLSEASVSTHRPETMRAAVENPMARPDLVRQFNEIITRAQVLVTDTQNAQFSVKLFPREIGRMEIDLRMIEGEIRGKIVVESEEVKNEMQNFLQNQDRESSAEQFDFNKIDIEVRNGNQNAQNPQQAPETADLLQNLVTQSATAVYSAPDTHSAGGSALYA